MNNKKQYLFNEAERQYIYKFLTVEELADRLNLSPRTIMNWKSEGGWDKKRKEFLKSNKLSTKIYMYFAEN